MQTTNWFSVDKEGLAAILERRGKAWAVLELIQNALDTASPTVDVTLTPVPGTPQVMLTVTDEDPDGFKDLTHAYTLFAPSTKAGDAEKRGRFNFGCKMVLALCLEATITSTTGCWHITRRAPVAAGAAGTQRCTVKIKIQRREGVIFEPVLEHLADGAGDTFDVPMSVYDA